MEQVINNIISGLYRADCVRHNRALGHCPHFVLILFLAAKSTDAKLGEAPPQLWYKRIVIQFSLLVYIRM